MALALGAFAPKVESVLSGAGWQANGSESVQARKLIQANFAGLSSSANRSEFTRSPHSEVSRVSIARELHDKLW